MSPMTLEESLSATGVRVGTQCEFSTDAIAPPKPEPQRPATRTVSMQIPAQITDQEVSLIWQAGFSAIEGVLNGVLVLFFPRTEGDQFAGVGRASVPLASQEDLKRMLDVARAIAQANQAQAQTAQSGNVGDQLTAAVRSRKDKDNAMRQAKAGGRGRGIIVP